MDIFIKRLAVFILVLAVYDVTIIRLVKGQYSGYNTNYGPHGGYGVEELSSDEADERPRVKLGLRLKIPAFRFELPRVNLPKITISAKIRQPDRPRTINLPEINLDTSSKVSAPGFGTMAGQTQVTSDNGGYDATSAYSKPTYQIPKYQGSDSGDIVNHFSFTTGEETSAKKFSDRNRYKQASTEYSSSQIQPSYVLAERNNYQNFNNNYQSKDPDLGFNAPINVDQNMLGGYSYNRLNSNQVMPYRVISSAINKNGNNEIELGMKNSEKSQKFRPSRYTNQRN